MPKNETELIIRRPEVTNNYVGAAPGAKRASYRPCILAAALAALFSVCAWSQTQLATVFGAITNPSGAVVPGVSITIVSQGTGLKRSVLTDTAGEYRFAGLPTGNYSLRLEKTGFLNLQIREGVEPQFGRRSDDKFATRGRRLLSQQAYFGQRGRCRHR